MAIPPIISNLPIFKIFSGDKAAEPKAALTPEAKAGPQDVVSISEAAQKKLSEAQAKGVAVETRDILEDTSVALGPDDADYSGALDDSAAG